MIDNSKNIHPNISFTSNSCAPSLSIVIRCRNQAKSLERVLRALELQEYEGQVELIIVDNESSDMTSELARQYGAQVIFISSQDYTHGRALNRGIETASGELILILSAHSLPVGRYFLQNAVAPFIVPDMAAAMCIKSDLIEFMGKWSEPEDIYWPPQERPATQAEMFAGVRKIMNSGLIIRRAVWEKHRFDESLESSEDKAWAIEVLCQGYKIRRCSEAVYVYLLRRNGDELIKRRIRSATAAYRITGQVQLNRRQYWLQNIRVFVSAARNAYYHIRTELMVNKGLMNIPKNAQQAPPVGSREENEQHR